MPERKPLSATVVPDCFKQIDELGKIWKNPITGCIPSRGEVIEIAVRNWLSHEKILKEMASKRRKERK